jgi:uncharacterized iron-regulated membrane protein
VKLGGRTYKIEWEMHAWAGVTSSILLFVVFYCGVFALFRTDIVVWQDPRLQALPPTAAVALEPLLAQVRHTAKLSVAASVSIELQPNTRFVKVYVSDASTSDQEFWMDPRTLARAGVGSRLESELYRLHFFGQVPGGRELSGLLALVFLVSLVAGIVIHLKDLVRQFWLFRPAQRLRHAASDAHKVVGVFGLPFALAFGWSGLLLGLSGLLGSGFAEAVYDGRGDRVDSLNGYPPVPRSLATGSAPARSLDELLARARNALGHEAGRLTYVSIQRAGDVSATMQAYFSGAPFRGNADALLDAVTGQVLVSSSARKSPAEAFTRVLYDTHFAAFGGLFLKVVYALLALGVCAVIVTGNVIWLERRDAARRRLGNRLLERATVGVCAGLVCATAGYFMANRSLPWGLPNRATWEFSIFLAMWTACAALAHLRQASSRGVATLLTLWAGALYGAVVIFDLVVARANLLTARELEQPAVLATNALLCALAVACVATGLLLRKSRTARTVETNRAVPAGK